MNAMKCLECASRGVSIIGEVFAVLVKQDSVWLTIIERVKVRIQIRNYKFFQLNIYITFDLSDINECEVHKSYNLCLGICENTRGSYRCTCPSGYTLAEDGRSCQVKIESKKEIKRAISECFCSFTCSNRILMNVPHSMCALDLMLYVQMFVAAIAVHTKIAHRIT